jgi:hypothetical protein
MKEVKLKFATGETYYANMYTEETQWERPTVAGRKPVKAPLPPGWSEEVDEDGDVYYYNEVTEETTWNCRTRPARRR